MAQAPTCILAAIIQQRQGCGGGKPPQKPALSLSCYVQFSANKTGPFSEIRGKQICRTIFRDRSQANRKDKETTNLNLMTLERGRVVNSLLADPHYYPGWALLWAEVDAPLTKALQHACRPGRRSPAVWGHTPGGTEHRSHPKNRSSIRSRHEKGPQRCPRKDYLHQPGPPCPHHLSDNSPPRKLSPDRLGTFL